MLHTFNTSATSFVSIVGEDNVDTSNMGRLTYSYDATPNFQAMPDAVIAPRNTLEVISGIFSVF